MQTKREQAGGSSERVLDKIRSEALGGRQEDGSSARRQKPASSAREDSGSGKPPISEPYKLLRFRTIRKTKLWWTVAMIIRMPSDVERLSIYRYRYDARSARWKKKSSISIYSEEDLKWTVEALEELSQHVRWRE